MKRPRRSSRTPLTPMKSRGEPREWRCRCSWEAAPERSPPSRVGVAGIRDDAVRPVGSLWTGASIGFALGLPLGVMLAGWLFDGDGAWWATILGDLAGLAAGAGAALLGGSEGVPLLFAFPLAGAVLGYETSSSPSRSRPSVTPVARLGPGGGSLGLAGRF